MLFLHHSNSLYRLLELLLQHFDKDHRPVLEAEQILVQNPGMKRWLQQQISRSRGIAANIDFPLPSRFIWDLFLGQFDDVETLSTYDGDVLRWRVMSLLGEYQNDRRFDALRPYIDQDNLGLARFQLAQKMAELFDQYLVYRPQMIKRWEQGESQDQNQAWQADLWRLLREQNPQPHRADLIQRLVQYLQQGRATSCSLPGRVFVFALSAMSPMYMHVLSALGQVIDVHIYILNPCLHYWGDIQSRKEQMAQGFQGPVDNELLASLGKQGRDYIDQFYEAGYPCHDNHQFVEISPHNLLTRIQQDILTLNSQRHEKISEADDSIQIFSCYSELRELQVLHDRLLDMLARDDALQAHEIVVMCPDINTLAPYIDAVFGQQPQQRLIPYSISDHNTLASSPLLRTVLDWIRLPSSRFTVSELLAWLEIPALQRAYDLDDALLEIIRHWIESTHIHWGRDHRHKQQLGLGDNNLNTWLHGINQLLSAYVMNEQVALFGGQLVAQTRLNQAEFHALGQLQRLLDDLARWAKRLSQPATMSQWRQHILGMMGDLLKLDDDEEWLLKPIREEMERWQQQVDQATFTESVDASLVSHILQRAIESGSTHHHYLSGGINFCNLIPMRTLPFKVVCLIGLGDESFPRNEVPLQVDIIAMHPQKGDRSRREDDRYMFLQSLLSAEQVFYISYVGHNRKDDSILEPSVVVSELIDYVRQSTGFEIPITQTPLQAFSPRNFALGSYAEQWQVRDTETLLPFNQPVNAIEIEPLINLDHLIAFYKNPVRYFMIHRLNISLQENEQRVNDDEVFTLDPLSRYQINQDLLGDWFTTGTVSEEKYLLSGRLAQQNSGIIQLEQLQQTISEIFTRVSMDPGYDGHHYRQFNLQLEEQQIHGRVASYASKGLLQFTQSSLKGKLLLGWWIEHCFLCASTEPEFSRFYHMDAQRKYIKKFTFRILSKDQAREALQHLVEGYRQGANRLMPLYTDSAYEYEKKRISEGEEKARHYVQQLWSGDDFKRIRDADDVYIQTSLKNTQGLPDEFYDLAARYLSPLLEAMET